MFMTEFEGNLSAAVAAGPVARYTLMNAYSCTYRVRQWVQMNSRADSSSTNR